MYGSRPSRTPTTAEPSTGIEAQWSVGGIGYALHEDVERVSAEVGYWLGVPFWGKGIMTAALIAITDYAFAQHHELRRIYAVPFAGNQPSIRVLEKAGYRIEGRMRESVIKDGRVTDSVLYATLRREREGGTGEG